MTLRFCLFRLYLPIALLVLFSCATDPGTNVPVAGGGVTFTYETGSVITLVNEEGTKITGAAVLVDGDPPVPVDSIAPGVTVTFPANLLINWTRCNEQPTLISKTEHTTSAIYIYERSDNCEPGSAASAEAEVIVSNGTETKTLNGAASTGATPSGSVSYTSSGTFVPAAGVTSITVECWGGGGGGGGAGAVSGGSGAGGGGYSKKHTISVTPGTTYTVTVGSGGAAGGASANGTAGGDSWFHDGTVVLAKGGGKGIGNAGAGGTGGQSSSGVGDTTKSGGNGGVNAAGTGGGGGSSAGTSSNGNNGTSAAAGSAPTGGGAGGAGGGLAADGSPGSSPGGGGGAGSIANRAGGAGASGKITITWPSS